MRLICSKELPGRIQIHLFLHHGCLHPWSLWTNPWANAPALSHCTLVPWGLHLLQGLRHKTNHSCTEADPTGPYTAKVTTWNAEVRDLSSAAGSALDTVKAMKNKREQALNCRAHALQAAKTNSSKLKRIRKKISRWNTGARREQLIDSPAGWAPKGNLLEQSLFAKENLFSIKTAASPSEHSSGLMKNTGAEDALCNTATTLGCI